MAPLCSYRPGIYAAIDIGTVTCRLFIAAISQDGQIDEIIRETNICNLGVGVDKTHRLQDEAIDRTVAVLSRYAELIDEVCNQNGIDKEDLHVRVIATSASRDAQNASEFQQKVEQQAALKLEVIPGEEEAALSFMGTTSVFPEERVVVVDIGGGSTEVVAGVSGQMPQFAHSFDIGCRRITERFLPSDPPIVEELEAARNYIREQMKPYFEMLTNNGCFEGRIVGVAGTATSAVSMRDQMTVYDPQKVHGSTVTCDDVESLLDSLAGLNLEQRKHIVGLESERAGVVVAGLLILQVVMELALRDAITVSEADILQGIVLESASVGINEHAE